MAERDVEINLIGRNRLSSATRAAANDLDRLARKVDQLEKKLHDFQSGNIKVKADIDRSNLGKIRALGTAAGNIFTRAMSSAINDGSRAIGNAIRFTLTKLPALQVFAAGFAARLLGLIGQAITAGMGLLLGPALLAAPIAFLLAQQLKASKQVETSEKKIASLKKRLEAAKSADVQARLRKEIAAEQQILAEQAKQAAQWDRLKARAKSFMEFISAPLKLPLRDALEEIGDGLDRLKGPMREIISALGPALAPFTKGVMDTLIAFIRALQPALPGIVAGMKAWAQEMPKIGKALGDMIAKIMSNPDAVVHAIQSISGVLQDLASTAGSIISVLTKVGNAFFFFESNIDALETGSLGRLTGVFRAFGTIAYQAMILALTGLDALFSSLARIPFVGSLFKGAADKIHTALLGAQQDFANTRGQWAATDAEIRRKKIVAKITAEKKDLDVKIAAAKRSLDTVKNKKTEAKIRANIADLKKSIASSKLTQLAKQKTVPKVQAAINDLQAKVKTAKSQLKSVKDTKTKAKIEATIKQAEAEIRRLKGLLASIPKTTTSTIRVNYETYRTNYVKTIRSMGGYAPNIVASDSWSSLNGGASHRTGGPQPINVEAPSVATRVFLDSHEISAVVRTVILDENKKQNYRARVGKRF